MNKDKTPESIDEWLDKVEKHLAAHGNGIALVFSRTDVQWFHKYIPKADAICFIKGRVQFVRASEAWEYSLGDIKPKGGCGAGSMLVAYGSTMAGALLTSNLGLTLPVSRNVETFRDAIDFAGGSHIPNENLPRISEHRQNIINAASAALREKQK